VHPPFLRGCSSHDGLQNKPGAKRPELGLILSQRFYVIKHDRIDHALSRFELQAEFLHCAEGRSRLGIVGLEWKIED